MRFPALVGMIFGMLSCVSLVAAPAFAPYEADEFTLHLWHLDEKKPPFKDSGKSPRPLEGLLNRALAGESALPGLGYSVSFNYTMPPPPKGPLNGPILLAKPRLDKGPADQVTAPFPVMGDDGAFTVEAVVKLAALPQDTRTLAACMISLDDEVQGQRVFLFRIEKPGFLSFLPISGNSAAGGGLASIPTTGPHAINTTDWFHVAATYSGDEGVTDNLKLYWTCLGAPNQKANLIGRGTLSTDLNRELGDFAIGNTGRMNPWEYFPGQIDEVRISSIARTPEDFFFVPPEIKKQALEEASRPDDVKPVVPEIVLRHVLVDEKPVDPPKPGATLELAPGPHRLDFDLTILPEGLADPPPVACLLENHDDKWSPAARGMMLVCETLDARGDTLSRTAFEASGTSPGWERDANDSRLMERVEPLFIPEATKRIRIAFSSGAPATTGTWLIGDFALRRANPPGENLWKNGDFEQGSQSNQPSGVPTGWTREGSERGIARLMLVGGGEKKTLGLEDAHQEASARWVTTQDLATKPAKGGETFLISWRETYNVIPGSPPRATYLHVPSGKYNFRTIAVARQAGLPSAEFMLPITIREPFWKRPWFVPAMVAGGFLAAGLIYFAIYRRRSRNRIAWMKLQSTLEQDRARIARDMHDDLGTRVSVLNLTASAVRQSLECDSGVVLDQVQWMESSARDLVQAMEGLVWAVNPANDTLDHLAAHLSGLAHNLFRDSPVKLRLSIPADLPAIPLRSDFRNHFALAVKESLHNALKHAGPACEVSLKLAVENDFLVITITDTGVGFDPSLPREGNGLRNLASRFKELDGTFTIESKSGGGTRVCLRCQIPELHNLPKS